MLNKDMLAFTKQGPQQVTMTAERFSLTSRSKSVGFDTFSYTYGKLEPVPFWGTPDNTLVSLFDHYSGSGFSYDYSTARITSPLDYDLKIIIGSSSLTIPKGKSVFTDNTAHFFIKEGSTYNVVFDPPPDGYLDPKTMQSI